jgi:aryl-alcohol dehydrogenase-like predicted oxidoreductase
MRQILVSNGEVSVAIAYLMQKTPYVFPLIGGRKIEHLLANIEALNTGLSSKQMSSIESITDKTFDLGFPDSMVVGAS